MKMNICVFGASSTILDNHFIETVEKLGEEMGKRGHSLVFGAGANGLMGAAARGVHKTGGNIYGVVPSFFKEESISQLFDKCTELIYTETMAQRKSKMEDMADAFIIVPGGMGTFEELFEVLTLKQLGRHTKPIVIYNIDNYYNGLEAFIGEAMEKNFIMKECKTLYGCFDSAEEVLSYIENDKQIKRDVHDLKLG